MKKAARSKKKRSKKLSRSFFLLVKKRPFFSFAMLLFMVFLVGGLTLYKARFVQPKLRAETEKNDMKKIPIDVKKSLANQVQSASVSAALHVPILMYHYVEYVQNKKDKERQLLNVNPNVFEQQLQTSYTTH